MVNERRPLAFVTGATRGIGYGIAHRLARDGYDLLLTARDKDALERAADTLRSFGGRIAVQAADLSKDGDVESLVTLQRDYADQLDVLVSAAGIGFASAYADFPLRKLDLQMVINFRSPFRLIQLLLPALRAAAVGNVNGSKIIALSSITGIASEPDLAAYGASKAALISLCESITASEAPHGVSATAISPGYVDTDMSAWKRDELDPSEMISVDDIAELASMLCRLSRWANIPNIVVTRPGPQLWRA